MTWDEFVNSPARPLEQRGTVFIDLLHAAGKHTLAHSFVGCTDDPFGKPTVPDSAARFCERMWEWGRF